MKNVSLCCLLCLDAPFDETQFRRAYTPAAYARCLSGESGEVSKIKYLSDGLKVVGYLVKPKSAAGAKLPFIIYNRGGNPEGVLRYPMDS